MQQFHNAKVMSHQSQYYFCVTYKNSDIDHSSCMSTGKKVPPAHAQRVFVGEREGPEAGKIRSDQKKVMAS